jgi:hypothetical protein
MPTGSPRPSAAAESLISDFARQPDVTEGHRDQLRAIIGSSPVLARQLEAAAGHGDLRRIRPLPESSPAGALYEPSSRTIHLRLSRLTPGTVEETTFVLGHEMQHALNRRDVQAADFEFFRQSDRAARRGQDYTSVLSGVLSAHRRDEATANLAGWNALADSLEQRFGQASPEMITARLPARAMDFVRRSPDTGELVPRSGLVINSDSRIDPSAENVAAMGRTYVDRPPRSAGLGHNGNSDYANYYGAWAIGVAAQIHVAHHPEPDGRPAMRVDLTRLRLSRDLMEQNGVDLGNRTEPVPLLDASTQPPDRQLLHHTATSHRHVPAVRNRASGEHQPARLARLGFTGRPQRAARHTTGAVPMPTQLGRAPTAPSHGRT